MAKDNDLSKRLATATKAMAHAIKSEAAPRLNAMVELARSEPGIPVLPDELDTRPWLFNCPNGTLELCTGQSARTGGRNCSPNWHRQSTSPKRPAPPGNAFSGRSFPARMAHRIGS